MCMCVFQTKALDTSHETGLCCRECLVLVWVIRANVHGDEAGSVGPSGALRRSEGGKTKREREGSGGEGRQNGGWSIRLQCTFHPDAMSSKQRNSSLQTRTDTHSHSLSHGSAFILPSLISTMCWQLCVCVCVYSSSCVQLNISNIKHVSLKAASYSQKYQSSI